MCPDVSGGLCDVWGTDFEELFIIEFLNPNSFVVIFTPSTIVV